MLALLPRPHTKRVAEPFYPGSGVRKEFMKSIERVLAAVDFSASSNEALEAAALLSQKVKGRLIALHVVRQTPFEGHFFGPVSVNLVNQIESKAQEELKSRLSRFSQEGI